MNSPEELGDAKKSKKSFFESPHFILKAVIAVCVLALAIGIIGRIIDSDTSTLEGESASSSTGSGASNTTASGISTSFADTTPGRLTRIPDEPTDSQTPSVAPEIEEYELDLPLKHTDVDASINGYVANVEVRQEFTNPFENPIEAVYTFPLSERGTVYDMQMIVGDVTIDGEVLEREAAQQAYQEAVDSGQRASLLEQQRPNIFTQFVGNILPGDEITIVIRYDEVLDFDKDTYFFNYPTVVGPRYIPGDFLEEQDPKLLRDTALLSPPVLPEGARGGNDISINIELNSGGIDITNLETPSHQTDVNQPDTTSATIALADGDTIPNKDFALEFKLESDRPEFGVFAYEDESGQGYFNLMIQPQSELDQDEVFPKEVYFMVDGSGSMSGEPIDAAKDAMSYAIRNLNENDTFYIDVFSSDVVQFSADATPYSASTASQALRFIDGIKAGGGTQMLPSIEQALNTPGDPDRLRMIVVMSDGLIGNESAVISAVKNKLADNTRLFSFGIGSSINRYLMTEIAEKGRGDDFFISNYVDPSDEVAKFYERIESPLLTNFEFDWGELNTGTIFPEDTPDLFAGQPLYISGTYDSLSDTQITISGNEIEPSNAWLNDARRLFGLKTGSRDVSGFSIDVPISSDTVDDSADWVARRWAREQIDAYVDDEIVNRADNTQQIIDVGVEYQIVTDHTSFVAIQEEVVNESGQTEQVIVPVELPDGTTREGFFGTGAATSPTQISGGSNSAADLSLNSGISVSSGLTASSYGSADSASLDPGQLVRGLALLGFGAFIALNILIVLAVNIIGNIRRKLRGEALKIYSFKTSTKRFGSFTLWVIKSAIKVLIILYLAEWIFGVLSSGTQVFSYVNSWGGVIAAALLVLSLMRWRQSRISNVFDWSAFGLLLILGAQIAATLYSIARYQDGFSFSDTLFVAVPLLVVVGSFVVLLKVYAKNQDGALTNITNLMSVGFYAAAVWLIMQSIVGQDIIIGWTWLIVPLLISFYGVRATSAEEEIIEKPT